MICAYCNKDRKCTREHIIPDSFLRGMNIDEQIRWTESAPCRVIKSDFVIKDVCAICNNENLSELDNYAIDIITKYNGKINKDSKKIFFKCDYNKLTRWLLKVLYNSARANKRQYDISLFKKCIPYILNGEKINNKISVFMSFIDLSINNKLNDYYHFHKESKYTVDLFRIAQFRLKDIYSNECTMRSIIVNSFAFLVVVYDDNIDEIKIKEIEQEIIGMNYVITRLENNKKIRLSKDKKFFGDSVYVNTVLHEDYLVKREVKKDNYKYYSIKISKQELEEGDFTQIQGFIVSNSYTKESTMENYQKFIISIDGYDDDTRELYCIPEFQKYIRELLEHFPEIVWYINVEIGIFQAMLLAFINNNSIVGTTINFDPEKIGEFLTKCFIGVNVLTNRFALDNSYNTKITELIKKVVFDTLKIPNNDGI